MHVDAYLCLVVNIITSALIDTDSIFRTNNQIEKADW